MKFKEKLSLVPNLPGSYQMYDKNGVIIYVGKAKDLKKRLSIHEDDCEFVNSIISRLRFMCTLVDIRMDMIIE